MKDMHGLSFIVHSNVSTLTYCPTSALGFQVAAEIASFFCRLALARQESINIKEGKGESPLRP